MIHSITSFSGDPQYSFFLRLPYEYSYVIPGNGLFTLVRLLKRKPELKLGNRRLKGHRDTY